MTTYRQMRLAPTNRHDWHGEFRSLDGTRAHDFTEADVAEVVAYGENDLGGGWDGEVAAILRLNDGRHVAFETFWGPTGDGFSYDAYGGNADILFAADADTAARFGLTKEGRRLAGVSIPEDDPVAPSQETEE